MTLPSNKITSFSFLHQNQVDFPNNVFPTSLAFKQAIDTQAQQCQTAINGTIDNLSSTTPGDSGSENIGSRPVSGLTGSTVYAQLSSASTQLQNVMLTPTAANMARQAVINGNFDVWQRGTSFTNQPNGTYIADRFKIIFINSASVFPTTLTHSRATLTPGDVANSFYGYRLTTDGAGTIGTNDVYAIIQPMENGTRFLCGNGRNMTVSFYARSSIAGKKLGVNMGQSYGTGGSPTSTETLAGTIVSLTSTWTRYTVTISTNTLVGKTFGTNNDDTLSVNFSYAFGATYATTRFGSAVTETFGGAGTIDIAQVQVNAGDAPLPFMPKSFEEELRACQRYCIAYTSSDANFRVGIGSAISTTVARVIIHLTNDMRIKPTLSVTVSDWTISDGVNTPTDLTDLTLVPGAQTTNTVLLAATVSAGLTQFRPYFLGADATANRLMLLDAEL